MTSRSSTMLNALREQLFGTGSLFFFVIILGLYLLALGYGDSFISFLFASLSSSSFSSSSSSSSSSISKWVCFILLGLMPMCIFFVYGGILCVVDFLPSLQHWRSQHKTQTNFQPSITDYIHATWIAIRNFVVVGLPFTYFLCWHALPYRQQLHFFSFLSVDSTSSITNISNSTPPPPPPTTTTTTTNNYDDDGDLSLRQLLLHTPFPTPLVFLQQFIVFLLVEEILFYFSHATLHKVSWLYKHVHKFHHEFTAPFGIAAIYAHPVEHLVSNVIPIASGPLICASHPLVALLWTTLALISTLTSHSGYHISTLGFPHPFFHDWHHGGNLNECFGVLQIFDSLFRTDSGYRQAEKEGRLSVPREERDHQKKQK